MKRTDMQALMPQEAQDRMLGNLTGLTELRDALRGALKAMSTSAQNHHAQCVMDAKYLRKIATPHKGPTWRKCTAFACQAVQQKFKEHDKLATPANHNEYALAAWKRKRTVQVKRAYN